VPDHRQAGDVRRQRVGTGFENNPFLDRLKRLRRRQQNAPVVAICAKTEADLADMDDDGRRCSWPRWGRTSRA
jgi:ribosome-binding ATPase YchF (GTP1/OBG family)